MGADRSTASTDAEAVEREAFAAKIFGSLLGFFDVLSIRLGNDWRCTRRSPTAAR